MNLGFICEEGIDTGGPRREFFRLMEKCRKFVFILHAGDDTRIFFHAILAYQVFYFCCDKLLVCTGVWSPLPVAPKCIPDQSIQSVLKKVSGV